jgi:hypothetical protein
MYGETNTICTRCRRHFGLRGSALPVEPHPIECILAEAELLLDEVLTTGVVLGDTFEVREGR